MSKRLLLLLALATLTVPRVFGMDWDPEDLENDGLKEHMSSRDREAARVRAMEREAEHNRLRALQVKDVAEQTFKGGPMLVFSEESLKPEPGWIGKADQIFAETIGYMVGKLGMRPPEIKKIKLHKNNRITSETLKFVARNFPGLTSIDISDCEDITIDGIQALVHSCPGLTYINITNCRSIHHTYHGQALRELEEIKAEYPQLHVIDNTPEETTDID